MSLSNLHSFHKRLRLQNATAFSGSHYLAVDNGTCVNPRMVQLSRVQSARRVILAQEPLLPPTLPTLGDSLRREVPSIDFDMVPNESLQQSAPTVLVHEKVAVRAGETQAIPVLPAMAANHLKRMDNPSEDARIPTLLEQHPLERGPIRSRPMPELSTKRHAPQRKASRMKWQPGRGTIEKVDKLTGEIVHLVELP